MAKTASATAEQTSKAILDAVKMLEKSFGNPAQTVAMRKKEQAAIEQWFQNSEDLKENIKKFKENIQLQKETQEREEKEKKLEHKTFIGGMKEWFKVTSETRTKTGFLLRGISQTWQSTSKWVVEKFKGAFGWLKSNFQEILGPLYDVFIGLKDLVFGPFKILFSFIKGMKDKTPEADIHRNAFLESIDLRLANKEKEEDRSGKPKKKGLFKTGIMWILGALALAAGAAIGAGVKKFLIPFELAWKAVSGSRVGKALGSLMDWFRAFSFDIEFRLRGARNSKFAKVFGKLMDWVKAVGSKIGALWAKVAQSGIGQRIAGWMKILKGSAKGASLFGKLLQGLRFGFRVLGWPLTILLGIIDFIKGFTKTEGTLFDKIKGGLMAALDGLIELPVKFIGWVIEKVMGLFGVEVSGIGDKMMDWIHTGFDFILDFNPFKPLVDFISGFWGAEGSFMDKVKAGFASVIEGLMGVFTKWGVPLFNAISPIVAGVANFFVDFWNSAVEWILSKIPDWLPGSDAIAKGLTSTKMSKIELPQLTSTDASPTDTMNDNTKAKAAAKKKEEEANAKRQEDLLAKQSAANAANQDKQNAVITQIANSGGGGQGGGDFRQTPDEVDNAAITFKNIALDFGD